MDSGRSGTAIGGSLPLELRLALRDLRGGLGGFAIFLICIALGTGAIGTINSLSDAIQDSIVREGKELLGGDAEATLIHRQAGAAERDYLATLGEIGEVATLRAMARKPDGGEQALVDLKAVDGAYPLYGAVTFEEGGGLGAVMREDGLAVDRSILDRLGIGLGDRLSIGRASFPVAAVLSHEPDRLAAGPAFGARILLSLDALKKTGLVEPGSLVRWSYRIKARAPLPASFKEDLASKFPEAGFLTRDSSDPSPGVKNMLQRLTEFLTLTGLTAMLTGGIGVANAVSGFIERRRKTIATYKSLGASQAIVFRVFLIEIGLLALIGIAIGFALAAAVPWASAGLMRDVVPIDIETGLQGRALGLAALFGLLTALPFILWPIGRAGQVRAAELFRDSSGERPGLPPLGYRLASFLAAGLLAAAAIALSQEHRDRRRHLRRGARHFRPILGCGHCHSQGGTGDQAPETARAGAGACKHRRTGKPLAHHRPVARRGAHAADGGFARRRIAYPRDPIAAPGARAFLFLRGRAETGFASLRGASDQVRAGRENHDRTHAARQDRGA